MHAFERTWIVPLLCLVSTGTLLGLSTNLAKLAGESQLPPLGFLFWSISGAALILLVVSASRKSLPPVNLRTFEYYSASAFTGVAGSNLIFFSAIPHVGAGFIALIITLPPVLTYVGALAFGLERFRAVRAAGVGSALAGTATLAWHKLSAPDADQFWILLAFTGPVLLSIGNLYRTMRWPEGVSADALAPGMLVAAAAILLGAGSLPGHSLAVPLGSKLALFLILTQALVFAAQFWLLFLLQKTGGPVLLSLLGSVGAAVGVPIAVFLQGEDPPGGLWLGVVLICAGVALLNIGRSRMQ